MSVTDAPSINLLDPNFYVDPFDAYRWLRNNSPVHWDPVQKIWGISRYADIVEVERNTKRYTSYNGSRPRTDQRADTSMINKDDPDHLQQRMLVARQFTPRAVKQIEDHIRGVVTELIDAVIEQGSCEAIDMLASPLPAIIIGEKLGYPRDMWTKVREWSEVTMYEAGQTPADGNYPDPGSKQMSSAIMDFAGHTMAIIAERRRVPQHDLITTWIQAGWSDQEVISECILLLDGGAETTRAVIGALIRDLALHPEQRQKLIDNPTILGDTAVEEFLRWVTPILNMRRTATEDHVFHGQYIKAGDELLLMYSSANRDDRVFDYPEALDVTRVHNRHVAFGFGTHFCLGASLARLKIRVMFEELLARMPDWQLAPDAEPKILGAPGGVAAVSVGVGSSAAPADGLRRPLRTRVRPVAPRGRAGR